MPFKMGQLVKRKPETTTFPELYEPFFIMFIEEDKRCRSGFMASENGYDWVCMSLLEAVDHW